ncbi:SDR family NAD(P)-dependent oxidoreductase [Kineococcus gynurae]|uniref:SDR family NAD(P)-dependent oxidoreductase n=1 Tax=Kineococcus gynurae TaxID=452979 RepID=A0ABV5LXA2_9ACTN
MSDLSQARILVTGASGGLGRPLVQQLAAAGATLVVSARDAGRLADLPGTAVAADLSTPGGPAEVVERAVAELGGLDGLVHAAGVVAFGPVTDADDDLLDEVLLADLVGPIRLLRAAVEPLTAAAKDRGDAFAAVVSAVVAETPMPHMAAYSAAKAGLSAFDAALGKELRRAKVRVLDIRPPHTETGLATRPVAGTAPKLPQGLDPEAVATRIVTALREDETDLPSSAFS